MLRTNVPRAVRHLRRHRGWRQADLALRTGISRQVISKIERGHVTRVPVRTAVRIADAFDATLDLTLRWQGEQLDRLVDAAHAAVVESAAAFLRSSGWLTRVEVSFNHYGDRGRVDVLAFHPLERMLLVVEAKSAIGDVQDTIGRLDVKARLGGVLAARESWGTAVHVVPVLVVAESRTARRTIGRHAAAFARFDVRGRSALAWLRHRRGRVPSGLLWFTNVPDSLGRSISRGSRVRADKSDG
jgi:transcriptional regulator with XRE-family HTH domain